MYARSIITSVLSPSFFSASGPSGSDSVKHTKKLESYMLVHLRWIQSGMEKLLQSPYSDGAAVCAFVSHVLTVITTTQHQMVAQVHSAKDLKANVLVRRGAIGALVVGRSHENIGVEHMVVCRGFKKKFLR